VVEWFQDATQGHTFAAWVVPDERSLEVSWLCGPYSAVFSNGIRGHGFLFDFFNGGMSHSTHVSVSNIPVLIGGMRRMVGRKSQASLC